MRGTSDFKDYFSSPAAAYASARPRYPAALFAYLAGQCAARDLAWDAGTCNGQAARGLAEYFLRVRATDASAAQIAQAEPAANIDYHCATAPASGCADQRVDLITAAQALHWFDQRAFFAEVDRVLKPGGVLAVWCYDLLTVSAEIDALISDFYHHSVGVYWPAERRAVAQGYAEVTLPYAEISTAEKFIMTMPMTRALLLDYISTWSAVGEYRRLQGHSPLTNLENKLRPLWADEHVHTARWDLRLRLCRKPETI